MNGRNQWHGRKPDFKGGHWRGRGGTGRGNDSGMLDTVIAPVLGRGKADIDWAKNVKNWVEGLKVTSSQLRKIYEMISSVSEDAKPEELVRIEIIASYQEKRVKKLGELKRAIDSCLEEIDRSAGEERKRKMAMFKMFMEAVVAYSKESRG